MSTSHGSPKRVVISGIGIFSPIGIGAESFWENLKNGKSGVSRVELTDCNGTPDKVAAEVSDFTESSAKKVYLRDLRKSIKVMCREIQLGVAAAIQALNHSELNLDEIPHERFGVDFGANLMFSHPSTLLDSCLKCSDITDDGHVHFKFDDWGTIGLGNMEPLWLLKYLPNMPACHIGIATQALGPSNSITLDEASGNLAVGEAFRIIERGHADVMLAGTTGTRIHPVKSMHFSLWDQLASAPEAPELRSRPFDRDRTGQVPGEGACAFLLEEESHAERRGANILGRVLGLGSSCVIDRDGQPNLRQALVNAMRVAIQDAGLTPQEIGHINAHGAGSRMSDIEEARAIQDVFGDMGRKVPVTALKSYLGNSGSGCGTLELAGSVLSLTEGVIPPTLNFENPDPECPLNVVHGEPHSTSNKVVLNINTTRMGQASALIVQGS